MSNEQQNYYAVIPSYILNAKDITDGQKLLYALISSLSNEKGYCYASNAYFSKRFGKTARSIQLWINTLTAKGYIFSKLNYKKGSKQVESRHIRIAKNFTTPHEENFTTPHEENFVDSIKEDINNKDINIYDKKKFIAPSLSNIEAFIKEKGYNVDAKGFFTYYDADNWRGVKSWKRRVATFHNNSQKHTHSKKTTTTIDDMYKALEGVT